MHRTNLKIDSSLPASALIGTWSGRVTTAPLTVKDKREALEFLAVRPTHTVALAGFICDNGIVSDQNRGVFYGCRGMDGQLEGVALIGHAILIEARTDRAIQALAEVAQTTTKTQMIMAEQECVERFLQHYGDNFQLSRSSEQLLFELRWPKPDPVGVAGLRLATLGDLELVVPIHAQMSFDESGIDPLSIDPIGFIQRCLRRIQQERTYVVRSDDQLKFKADVIAETSEATYLEGIWANPLIAGSGYAVSCLTQLAGMLLSRTESICLLSNADNKRAKAFYLKTGFTQQSVYQSVFLKRAANSEAP